MHLIQLLLGGVWGWEPPGAEERLARWSFAKEPYCPVCSSHWWKLRGKPDWTYLTLLLKKGSSKSGHEHNLNHFILYMDNVKPREETFHAWSKTRMLTIWSSVFSWHRIDQTVAPYLAISEQVILTPVTMQVAVSLNLTLSLFLWLKKLITVYVQTLSKFLWVLISCSPSSQTMTVCMKQGHVSITSPVTSKLIPLTRLRKLKDMSW